ncbi:Acetolactate synthase large subunit [Pseudonocardia ammonioxydans]|uniref:Acetolactate synthase large subunit n=1 Tax=Pseudonocardia ammonioxydans TaxID=260086 RepID=A0A1I5FXI3_PSUAM|nr:thiamine pyrophosphate-binding protein [Pseudonocardia ammonioxydans]SFO28538.1 Acetolactate synthase large subunit [Pseudonocardia ammonioxydans]
MTVEEPEVAWGSDAIAAALRATGVPYIALNPGSSYRGLHDSLVNLLGNTDPEMLLCLHEEHAVAIAHGYSKVTDMPMAAAVHSNVGLMHASMAVYNAYLDRAPLLLLGATGPVDAAERRPWIDWIHTSADQGALVRPFVKWDDQPASVQASVTSVLRANQITRTQPTAPVYVCFDVSVQEQRLTEPAPAVDVSRFAPVAPAAPPEEAVLEAVRLLTGAGRTVILAGRASRDQAEWDDRIALVERLGASVLTDLKVAAGFPTDHPLHAGHPGLIAPPAILDVIRSADVVLSLDWVDLGGLLAQAFGDEPTAKVIAATSDFHLHRGWTKDDQVLAPVDVRLPSRSGPTVTALLRALPDTGRPALTERVAPPAAPVTDGDELSLAALTVRLREATEDLPVTLVRMPISWDASQWPITEPLAHLGADGGAGVGSGPGLVVGAALALRGSGRLPVAVLGDGDYLMGVTALWTAARHDIPFLIVVANNRSYFNDEVHQAKVAEVRGRPLANAHIGLRIDEPAPDLAGLARGQGIEAYGPVGSDAELVKVLDQAVESVRAGRPVVVEVLVQRGYGKYAAQLVGGDDHDGRDD